MEYEINKEHWNACNICNKKLVDLKKEYGGNNKYFANCFIKHIKNHDIQPCEYFEKLGLNRPICKCGICGKKTDIVCKRDGKTGIYWREYACGRYDGSREWCKRAREERKGSGNPMFGKSSWNKGLGLEDPRVEKIAASHRGIKLSDEHKKKISESYDRSLIRHGTPHSKETVEKLRLHTLDMIKRGIFKQTRSKPHIAMCSILQEMGIEFEEEKIINHFSFDIYLPRYNLYIEVDGDYWHSNPKFYPNGPETKIQKINKSRDISKNNFCLKNGINLIRFWEDSIFKNRDRVKEDLICKLNQLKE